MGSAAAAAAAAVAASPLSMLFGIDDLSQFSFSPMMAKPSPIRSAASGLFSQLFESHTQQQDPFNSGSSCAGMKGFMSPVKHSTNNTTSSAAFDFFSAAFPSPVKSMSTTGMYMHTYTGSNTNNASNARGGESLDVLSFDASQATRRAFKPFIAEIEDGDRESTETRCSNDDDNEREGGLNDNSSSKQQRSKGFINEVDEGDSFLRFDSPTKTQNPVL